MPLSTLTKNRSKLLEVIADLRVSDLELLTGLLGEKRFGHWGIRRATEAFLKDGLIHRLWKFRDPQFRVDHGSKRQVFLVSQKGAEELGQDKVISYRAEKWFEYLKDPRRSYLLEHELMIARLHGALIKQGLDSWRQGEGTQIDSRGLRITPDAHFVWNRRHFFLEADTGQERLRSDDEKRRTIEKKVRRYGQADRDEIPQEQFDIPGFSVLFLTPRRFDPTKPSGRELGILEVCREQGHLKDHAKGFYQVISETQVMASLRDGVPLFPTLATLKVPAGGLSSSPRTEAAPTHEPV